jgi:hypothetical protein
MAFYPCSNHHASFRGPSYAAYPAIVNGASSARKHLRLCQDCFGDYIGAVEHRLHEVEFDASDQSDRSEERICRYCGTKDVPLMIFVNAYPKGEPERAFYGGCCSSCEPQAKAEILLS